MVLSCTTGEGCEHEYQDQRYGRGMRVHESCGEEGQNRGSATCTVCGRVRTNPKYVPNLRVVKESEA